MKFVALVLLLWGTPIPFNWAIERELKRAGLVDAYRSSRLLLLRSDVPPRAVALQRAMFVCIVGGMLIVLLWF